MATRIKPARPDGGLYEADVVAWAEAQAEAPRAGRLDELDSENLAEDVADVGRREGGRAFLTGLAGGRVGVERRRGPGGGGADAGFSR
jgi:hypothetical protein